MYLVIWIRFVVFRKWNRSINVFGEGFRCDCGGKGVDVSARAKAVIVVHVYNSNIHYKTIYYIGLRFGQIFRKTEYQSYRSGFLCFLWRSIRTKWRYLFLFFSISTHTRTHATHRYSKTVYINEVNCENRKYLIDSLFFQIRRRRPTKYLIGIQIS